MQTETPCLETSHGAVNHNHCQYIRGQELCPLRCRSDSLQIVSRGLACSSIGNNVEGDFLSLAEGAHAGAFDRADVYEDIFAAIIRLDKAEAFLVIEELHGSLGHITLLSDMCAMRPHVSAAGSLDFLRKIARF
jgi:hypothetical protein